MGQSKLKKDRKEAHQIAEQGFVQGFARGVTYLIDLLGGLSLPAVVVRNPEIEMGEYEIHCHPDEEELTQKLGQLPRIKTLLEQRTVEEEAANAKALARQIQIDRNNWRIEQDREQRQVIADARKQYTKEVLAEAENIVQARRAEAEKEEAVEELDAPKVEVVSR